MDNRPRVSLEGKAVNLAQLDAELGRVGLCGSTEEVVAAEGAGITQAQLEAAVGAHVADSEWRPTLSERDWRTKLQTELEWLRAEVAGAPAAGTTTAGNAVVRVDAVIQHLKRLDRDLIRLVEFIRDNTLDSGNGP